ncbi:hypothetical protein BASA81_000635 [Batrachochytrium salamandrivorans]|nr:hypothetical protein BASA81_000635 [Batrachochytrium salamandrivorans]
MWLRRLSSLVGKPKPKHYELNAQIKSCANLRDIERVVLAGGDFNAVNCATALRMLARHRCGNSLVMDKIVLLSSQAKPFPPQSLSNCLHAIASGRLFNGAIPAVFTRELLTESDFAKFNSHDIANVLWAVAKINPPEAATVFDLLGREIKNRSEVTRSATPQALANILWSFATLRIYSPQVCAIVCRELKLRNVTGMTLQELANPLWALAVLKHVDRDLLDLFSRELVNNRTFSSQSPAVGAVGCKPQDVSNTVWAMAVLEHPSRALCDKICREVTTFKDYRAQEVSNTLWAFATLKHPRLPSGIATQICTQDLQWYTAQALANIAWSFASLGKVDSLVCLRISNELMRRQTLQEFTPEALCILLWSFAQSALQSKSESDMYSELFGHLCGEVVKRDLSKFQANDLSQLVWAMAMTGYWSPLVNAKVYKELVGRDLASFKLHNLSAIALSMARLNYVDAELTQHLASEFVRRHHNPGNDPSCLLVALWAFSCLDALHLPKVFELFQLPAPSATAPDRTADAAQQLFQVRLNWDQTCHDRGKSNLIEELCDGGWLESKLERASHANSSQAHVHLLQRLREQGLQVESEVELLGGLVVDMLVDDQNVVIEVDGPAHFLSDCISANGSTRFKHRLLTRAGYRVISVPVVHFSRLSPPEQAAYCNELATRINTCT